MGLTPEQRIRRLEVRTAEVARWRVARRAPLRDWRFAGAPIEPGAPWPRRDGLHRLSARGEVPPDWPLDLCRLWLDAGGESLLEIAAEDGGAVRRHGLDVNHREFPLPGRRLALSVEAVARLPFGEPVETPRLVGGEIRLIDPGVDRLRRLLALVAAAATELGPHEAVPPLLSAAEAALAALDWPSGTEAYVARMLPHDFTRPIWESPELLPDPPPLDPAQSASVGDALAGLEAALAELARRYPPSGRVLLTGHAHVDLAWLWPYEETRRKLRRTFHTALGLLDRHEGLTFNQSTAAYYLQADADEPGLLDAVRERVREGRWEPVGGLWIEPDTNMPAGESLVRQVLYGQRWFEANLGARHDTCWLPDCFGFSPALPQILRRGGITNFFTIKVNWSETNRFPHDLFWWEGLDGSRVLAHTFDNPVGGYNGELGPRAVKATWDNFRGKAQHGATLLSVGFGDGGGGPTEEMILTGELLPLMPALPRAEWGRVTDFFAGVRAGGAAEGLPVWSGEIYLEFHRGTLTTQGRTKRLHRQAERALVEAEAAAGLAALSGGPAPRSLEPEWRSLLKNEFHDILPGSSIREVYEEAEAELTACLEAAEGKRDAALGRLAGLLPQGGPGDAVAVVNLSASPQPLRLTLPDGRFVAAEGEVPPLGLRVLRPGALRPAGRLSAGDRWLENDLIRAEIGEEGEVARLFHKPTGREALAPGGSRLVAYVQDKPRVYDAWDIEEDYEASARPLDPPESIRLLELGPHRAAIRIERRFRDSRIVQTVSLAAGCPRLDLLTELDWHDRRVLLRVLVQTTVRAPHGTAETAFGVQPRATHRNTSWDAARFEFCAHRFLDLSDPGFGVALLNDGRYGHSLRGGTLGLSLLRSPIYPDPFADEGRQAVTYALLPHAGPWHAGRVREEAELLNAPLRSLPAPGAAEGDVAPLAAEGVPVGFGALKAAEDGSGDLILRVHEAEGRQGGFALRAPPGWAVGPALNLLEEEDGADPLARLGPFEIRTLRLRRTP